MQLTDGIGVPRLGWVHGVEKQGTMAMDAIVPPGIMELGDALVVLYMQMAATTATMKRHAQLVVLQDIP